MKASTITTVDKALNSGAFGSLEPISVEYFRDELARFREVITSTEYSLELKDRAFKAIALLALNLDAKDPAIAQADNWWEMTAMEWSRRRVYELARK